MATYEDFILRMKVQGSEDVKEVRGNIQNLKGDLQGLGQVGGPLGNTINGIVGKFGALGSAATLAVGAFAALGGKALQIAGELADISGATGIAAGTLMNFKTSVVEAGGKADDFAQIATKLNQSIQEAASGNEKLQKAFKDLGVYVTDTNGAVRSTESILKEITDKFNKGEISAKEYAAAIDIMGKNINKLELAKLKAARDPITDANIKRLDEYNDAMDKLSETIGRKLVTVFGALAKGVNSAFDAIDAYNNKLVETEKRLNAIGKTTRAQTLPGEELMSGEVGAVPAGLGGRNMTAAEKAALQRNQEIAARAESMKAYVPRPSNRGGEDAGGFGATPEATLKAIAESEKRLRQSSIDSNKNYALKGSNEIQAIEINAAAEVAKARENIYAQERLSDAQKAAEFAAKKKEIEAKASLDTAKARSQLNAKIYSEEEAQRQKNAEELAQEESRINAIVEASSKIVTEIEKQNAEMAAKAKFSLDAATMTDNERANAQALFDIEQQRLALLQQIADIKDLPYAERLAREKQVNDLLNQRKADAVANGEAQARQQEDFSAGWQKSYRQYVENSKNSFSQAQSMFSTLSNGFENSMVRFVQTGKLSFRSLFNDLIAQAVRASANRLLMSILGSMGGSSGGGGFFSSLFGGFRAEGGPVSAGTPYVVGEKGPEMFVPKSAGTIIPNGAAIGGGGGVTNVNYSIQAVDASSFRSLVARDPEFIFNVTEQGRRNLPGRSRR